jgi:hypothetical protein
VDGADTGWMQSVSKDGAIVLAQLFVESALQRRGIGTASRLLRTTCP